MAIVMRTLDEVRKRAHLHRRKRTPKTEEEIREAAESDPDTWLPTEEELKRFRPWRERATEKAKALSENERNFDDED